MFDSPVPLLPWQLAQRFRKSSRASASTSGEVGSGFFSLVARLGMLRFRTARATTRSKPEGWSAALNPRWMTNAAYRATSNAAKARTAVLQRLIWFCDSYVEQRFRKAE